MVSGKEIIEITGISRAVLNSLVSLGLLARPKALVSSNARVESGHYGYFPDEALDRVKEILKLKEEGISMTDIVARLGNAQASLRDTSDALRQEPSTAVHPFPPVGAISAANLRVTLEDIPQPAYMVNHNFELAWINTAAREEIFGGMAQLPANAEDRNIFSLLEQAGLLKAEPELVTFHLGLAKSRLSVESFHKICQGLGTSARREMEQRFDDVAPLMERPVAEARMTLSIGGELEGQPLKVYASFFREGIFVAYAKDTETAEPLLDLLSRRDEIIRNLLRNRLPVLTPLAVLVADLQSSVKICSELPPEEYFELINEIWATMGPIFRKYRGTCGKHVGDGMVYYFFPQPDSDYLMNAVCCAHEIRQEVQKLSKSWQIRKNWLNELYLNTGLTEGQEWLGTFQSSTNVEFVVLGDTINQAARISDFARHGSVWATKSLIGKLPTGERNRLRYGVRRKAPSGQDVFVNTSFSLVSTLLEQDGARSEKLRDIATLPITEIVEIADV
ncbi:MAG: hypothetical protein EKK46_01615 [Rhodocyclaceae bacterium]|nr:MAG: hypothetical protein EKK46_01615 [Rhodocyclaceae bacterium]